MTLMREFEMLLAFRSASRLVGGPVRSPSQRYGRIAENLSAQQLIGVATDTTLGFKPAVSATSPQSRHALNTASKTRVQSRTLLAENLPATLTPVRGASCSAVVTIPATAHPASCNDTIKP